MQKAKPGGFAFTEQEKKSEQRDSMLGAN